MNLLHGLSVSVVDPYWIRIGSVLDPYSGASWIRIRIRNIIVLKKIIFL